MRRLEIILDFVIPGLLTAAGIIMGMLALLLALQSSLRLARWKRATGILVTHKREQDNYLPIIEHCVGGTHYRITSDFGRGVRFGKRGDRIKILYDPKQPDRGTMNTAKSLWLFPVALLIMSVLFLAFAGTELCARISDVMGMP